MRGLASARQSMPFVERCRYSFRTLNICKGPSFGGQGSLCALGPTSSIGGIKDRQGRRIVGRISFTRPKYLPEVESNVYVFRSELAPPFHGVTGVQEIRSRLKLRPITRLRMSRPNHLSIFFSEKVSVQTEMDDSVSGVFHICQNNGGRSD